ncbi:uncharacterized protein LOC126895726 isoform X2 [Daktulosphaira vitifoliae]|uniref:uncharacterized protein LOC126895726 isoform X2 n=1 Tax=Daktulosphaira vitifoliae TaxID=58002 RepID=UPI0021A990A2|nr:uncharacterized protein LOC126895726 isoform X2 [Daktulosphaira vitifoliae]
MGGNRKRQDDTEGQFANRIGNGPEETDGAIRRIAASAIRYNTQDDRVRYRSWLLVPDGFGRLRRLVADLVANFQRSRNSHDPSSVVVIATHDEHLHLVHTCTSSNSSCRCTWIKKTSGLREFRRSKLERKIYRNDLNEQDWKNVLGYFSKSGRVCIFCFVGGRSVGHMLRCENVPKAGHKACGKFGLLETCIFENNGDLPRELSTAQNDQEFSSGHSCRNKTRSKFQTGQKTKMGRKEFIKTQFKNYSTGCYRRETTNQYVID